jgi:glutaredoxin 3
MQKKVVIYTTQGCSYCTNAKELLSKKGIKYEEIKVDKDPNKLNEMVKLSKKRSFPQIFIDQESIGGFDDLSKLAISGKLDTLLKDE